MMFRIRCVPFVAFAERSFACPLVLLAAAACCIFYPIYEAGGHILYILSHLVRCQTAESRDEAVLDTVKEVMPPQDMVGAHPLKN